MRLRAAVTRLLYRHAWLKCPNCGAELYPGVRGVGYVPPESQRPRSYVFVVAPKEGESIAEAVARQIAEIAGRA